MIVLATLFVEVVVGLVFMGYGIGAVSKDAAKSNKDFGSGDTGIENRGIIFVGHCLFWPALVAFIVWGILLLILFIASFHEAKEMEAFYRDTLATYEYTVDATTTVVIDADGTRADAITDFTYQEQGVAVSERIKELRNKVEWYNATLRKLNAKNSLPVIGTLFHDTPDGLKPIVLERVLPPVAAE